VGGPPRTGREARRTRLGEDDAQNAMTVFLQIVGAVLVLSGFVLAQFGVLRDNSPAYLIVNFLGAALLAGLALLDRQWGFLLLEGVWALVSLRGVAVAHRQRADDPVS
jgi:uncharacterized membrane protein YeaQ/YmgE (transglycosylase-associated protein family)